MKNRAEVTVVDLLTIGQEMILNFLLKNPKSNPVEISDGTGLGVYGIYTQLRRMTNKGRVSLNRPELPAPRPKGRPRVEYTVTDKGKQELATLQAFREKYC